MSLSPQTLAPGVAETSTSLLLTRADGTVLELRKPWSDEACAAPPPEEQQWPDSFFDALLSAPTDVLGEQVLAAGEPSYEAVASLLPPPVDYGFVGCEGTLTRPVVDARTRVEGLDATADLRGRPRGPSRWGWLGGRPPVLCVLSWADGAPAETTVFTAPGRDGRAEVWRRRRCWSAAGPVDAFDRSGLEPPSAELFYRLLAEVHEADPGKDGLPVELPEPDLAAAASTMLSLARLTFRGVLPRYGVGTYDQEMHNSFPPTILSLCEALLAWGHTETVCNLLDHYLSRYLRTDGTLDYYGPALAEYGQLLSLIALIVQRTQAWSWFRERLPLVRSLWRRLLDLREHSRARCCGAQCYDGLVPGLPEADYHGDASQWETCYYSGNIWLARGLLAMGKVLASACPFGLRTEGEVLLAAGEEQRATVLRSLERDLAANPEYVPPAPDQREPLPDLTASRHASYCNYRYFPEMISAGILPQEIVRKIVDWRRSHGGELLGMTRFERQLDDWPASHNARALLELGDADHYLLLLYSHWAHHCAQGHLASYEQVSIRPDEEGRRYALAGQVVPCQVLVPLLLRWGLIYEERDADRLWLCGAVPRRWLRAGSRVAVQPLPTRFGDVGFALEMAEAERGTCVLLLPEQPLAAEVCLRLRAPDGLRLATAALGETALPVAGEHVCLPPGLAGRVAVRFSLAPG